MFGLRPGFRVGFDWSAILLAKPSRTVLAVERAALHSEVG